MKKIIQVIFLLLISNSLTLYEMDLDYYNDFMYNYYLQNYGEKDSSKKDFNDYVVDNSNCYQMQEAGNTCFSKKMKGKKGKRRKCCSVKFNAEVDDAIYDGIAQKTQSGDFCLALIKDQYKDIKKAQNDYNEMCKKQIYKSCSYTINCGSKYLKVALLILVAFIF